MMGSKEKGMTRLLVIAIIGLLLIVIFLITNQGNNNQQSTSTYGSIIQNTSSQSTISVSTIPQSYNTSTYSSTTMPYTSSDNTTVPTTISSTTSQQTTTLTPTTTVITTTWSEQLGVEFTQNIASLAYNVTAVAQTDQYGCGPTYLVNGLSNKGWWYQIGLEYAYGCSTPGFAMDWEVFPPGNTNGTVIPPGVAEFNGKVNAGDKILLDLLPSSNGTLIMEAIDWNTGAVAKYEYSFEGASTFVGTPQYCEYCAFTGLMTEWQRPYSYYGNEQQVTYSEYGNLKMSGFLFAFGGGTKGEPYFYNNTSTASQNAQLTADGATLTYLNGTTFISGN